MVKQNDSIGRPVCCTIYCLMNKNQCFNGLPVVLFLAALIAVAAAGPWSVQAGEGSVTPPQRSVFSLPALQGKAAQLELELVGFLRAGRYADAEKVGNALIEVVPEYPSGYYNRACAQALQGKTDAAFASLALATQRGFNDPDAAEKDPDLASLRNHPDWAKVKRVMAEAQPFKAETRQVVPQLVTNDTARLSESNTSWNSSLGILQGLFNFPKDGEKGKVPATVGNEEGKLIREWCEAGTAAGLYGDLYDNRDQDHSDMNRTIYPQLTWIEYAPEAVSHQMNRGLQVYLLFNRITFGNASLANVDGRYWRSMPRLAYPDGRLMTILFIQYVANHIYVYPEHQDYDPGRNGEGGYGDVYCGNSPYLVISQGSSGSDQVFLRAIACTLAAFRPEVKEYLATKGALMPAVQMLLRSCSKQVKAPEDYLKGTAHPTVFDGQDVDAARMVQKAHEITLGSLPPQIFLKVEDEDKAMPGRDYFDPRPSEILYETPAAIGRVFRTTKYHRRMVVSAADSKDLNGAPLTYHWRVLRGDADRIQIKPLNKSGSRVELTIPYHERFPVSPGSKMEGNRVDIGAFVSNGKYYSAPAFVSFFFLDNETRVYGQDKKIRSVQYSGARTSGNYVDPMVDMPKDWLDEYQYDANGALLGWTRTLGETEQKFTADGKLIVASDDSGKPKTTRDVVYVPLQMPDGKIIVDQK